MIDEYLLEPNNINKEWVECLQMCKQALAENEQSKKSLELCEDSGEYWESKYNNAMAELERLQAENKNISVITLKKFERNMKDVQVTFWQTWEIQNALKQTLKEMVGDKE